MKIRPVGAELFYADRQTDITKLTVACRNFANAPEEQTAPFAAITACVFLSYFCGASTLFQVMAYLLRRFATTLGHNTLGRSPL